MINRNNWQLRNKYLEYRKSVDQLCLDSYKIEKAYMGKILKWAGESSYINAPAIRPTLQEYLKDSAIRENSKSYSPVYTKKILATARRFFVWLVDNQQGYKSIKLSWINTLKAKRLSEIPKQREAVTVEQIREIAKAPVDSTEEQRTQAMAVMLFLSGMRIGAFVSLPLKAVDVEQRKITQYPNLGVRTKNGKYAITNLLPINDLLEIVRKWDKKVRSLLPPEGFWFAPLSPETGEIDVTATKIGLHRETLARKNLQKWVRKVGIRYLSPHKYRHGHIQYGLARSKSHADYKAVSMNVMHTSIQITDQFYSNITDEEIKKRIEGFSV
jgi:integrase